jgi:DNA (cytosine-5)-methyltransferase 1
MITIGSLCTGYGGLDIAARAVFGGHTVWWSDVDPGAIAAMSVHEMFAPNIGDIKTADWSTIPAVDIITAGYPCQPFSNAGHRKGTDDPRHLWPFVVRAVGILRPRIIVLENVAAHLRRGFDVVLADLAEIRYDALWTVVRASDIGAPHRRERLFVVATSQNPDSAAGFERRTTASGQAPGGRPWADTGGRGGIPAGNTTRLGWHVGHHGSQLPAAERNDREPKWRPEAADDRGQRLARWGKYTGAVARWEAILGRPVPEPTVTGVRGATVLSPYLTEWMMGLPEGHITAVPGLSRNQMIKLAGNGVVPQQAEYALRQLVELP